MMAKHTRTRAQRVTDAATDEINVVHARTDLSPKERSQEVRRALKLRWARQRRLPTLACNDH